MTHDFVIAESAQYLKAVWCQKKLMFYSTSEINSHHSFTLILLTTVHHMQPKTLYTYAYIRQYIMTTRSMLYNQLYYYSCDISVVKILFYFMTHWSPVLSHKQRLTVLHSLHALEKQTFKN